jgi:hypothetical protein
MHRPGLGHSVAHLQKQPKLPLSAPVGEMSMVPMHVAKVVPGGEVWRVLQGGAGGR